MTKKDYEAVARALNVVAWEYQNMPEARLLISVVDELCREFKHNNSRFNPVMFENAVFKKG